MQVCNLFSSLAVLCFIMATKHLKCIQSKEVSKSKFGQEEHMEKQRWEESEKSREEARRSEKRNVTRKKMQVRERVEKSRSTVWLP